MSRSEALLLRLVDLNAGEHIDKIIVVLAVILRGGVIIDIEQISFRVESVSRKELFLRGGESLLVCLKGYVNRIIPLHLRVFPDNVF